MFPNKESAHAQKDSGRRGGGSGAVRGFGHGNGSGPDRPVNDLAGTARNPVICRCGYGRARDNGLCLRCALEASR